jgi:undecaprenyl-diphosphatase
MKQPTKLEQKQVQFTAGLIAVFAVFAICVMGFVKIAWEVREQETNTFDDAVLNGIHSISNPFLDNFVPIATNAGGVLLVSVMTLIILGLFIYKNEYRRAVLVGVAMAGAAFLNVVLKAVFERARPDLWDKLVHESSYSFPSGHSMMSAALGLALVVALWNSRWRWWAVGLAALYIPFIGLTRLYLGVHYPTDVVAGWLVSGAWVMAVALLMRSKLGHQALKRLP